MSRKLLILSASALIVLAGSVASAELIDTRGSTDPNIPPMVTIRKTMTDLWQDSDPLPYIPTGQPFPVWKYITNGTNFTWTDFHMEIGVIFEDGTTGRSTEQDGISFAQPTPMDEFLEQVDVDIDGLVLPRDSYTVMRMNQPTDSLWFVFDDFVVPRGRTLSLHFPMQENNSVAGTPVPQRWFLSHHASIPEPTSILLFGIGMVGLAYSRRSRGRRS